jgi:hypothetical protein
MAARVETFSVDGVDVLVQTLAVAGSEQTSGRLNQAGQKVVDAFDTAQSTIEVIARRMAGTVSSLAHDAVHPSSVAVEFGLSFTASGGVVVAGASAQASLKVTIAYDRSERAVTSSGGARQGAAAVAAGS